MGRITLRINAIYVFIVFCFRSLCQGILYDFVPEYVLAYQDQIGLAFIFSDDLKICPNLIKLTGIQAESQWEHI